jgi:4-hydroxy-3-polyprenylbenzoate decarboxylase
VVTRGPHKPRQNLGIYRQQVIGPNKVIMRWLAASRRRAGFPRPCGKHPGQPFPGGGGARLRSGDHPRRGDAGAGFAVRIPVRRPAARRQDRAGEVPRLDLQVPASAEIVLEGVIHPGEMARKAPSATTPATTTSRPNFPVFTIERITMRRDPIYHSTYTGKPPDEPAMLGVALNEVFVPLLQKQFPEITDFYLPPEGCSYRWRWSA